MGPYQFERPDKDAMLCAMEHVVVEQGHGSSSKAGLDGVRAPLALLVRGCGGKAACPDVDTASHRDEHSRGENNMGVT